jgi:hypothetical protein
LLATSLLLLIPQVSCPLIAKGSHQAVTQLTA